MKENFVVYIIIITFCIFFSIDTTLEQKVETKYQLEDDIFNSFKLPHLTEQGQLKDRDDTIENQRFHFQFIRFVILFFHGNALALLFNIKGFECCIHFLCFFSLHFLQLNWKLE